MTGSGSPATPDRPSVTHAVNFLLGLAASLHILDLDDCGLISGLPRVLPFSW